MQPFKRLKTLKYFTFVPCLYLNSSLKIYKEHNVNYRFSVNFGTQPVCIIVDFQCVINCHYMYLQFVPMACRSGAETKLT